MQVVWRQSHTHTLPRADRADFFYMKSLNQKWPGKYGKCSRGDHNYCTQTLKSVGLYRGVNGLPVCGNPTPLFFESPFIAHVIIVTTAISYNWLHEGIYFGNLSCGLLRRGGLLLFQAITLCVKHFFYKILIKKKNTVKEYT